MPKLEIRLFLEKNIWCFTSLLNSLFACHFQKLVSHSESPQIKLWLPRAKTGKHISKLFFLWNILVNPTHSMKGFVVITGVGTHEREVKLTKAKAEMVSMVKAPT